jgi:PAS domain-containing protein
MQSSPTTATAGLTAMLSSSLVRSVLDSLPDAIVIIDSSGNILFANHRIEAMFGFSSAEVVGGPVEGFPNVSPSPRGTPQGSPAMSPLFPMEPASICLPRRTLHSVRSA